MKKGFTLIELLVVIAIIAILAAMLMPALSRARAEARKAACISNEHSIGTALVMYTNDHGIWPNGIGDSSVAATTGGAVFPLCERYDLTESIFSCPADPVTVGRVDTNANGIGALTDVGYRMDCGIPVTADPMRGCLADDSTLNHADGSVVLFCDSHVKFLNETAVDVVPNIYHEDDDTNIYADDSGVSNDIDCDMADD